MDIDEPYHIRRIADRIRQKGTSGLTLGVEAIRIVLANRNKPELMRDCQLIIQSYPGDFVNRT